MNTPSHRAIPNQIGSHLVWDGLPSTAAFLEWPELYGSYGQRFMVHDQRCLCYNFTFVWSPPTTNVSEGACCNSSSARSETTVRRYPASLGDLQIFAAKATEALTRRLTTIVSWHTVAAGFRQYAVQSQDVISTVSPEALATPSVDQM